MSDEGAGELTAAETAAVRAELTPASPWQRFVDRFIPAEERVGALWILGIATLLSCIRAVTYQPLQAYISARVFSPRIDELGFALRATAITDVIWGVFAGIFIVLVFRFTKAPRATALYIVLAGLLVAIVTLGNRLALDAVMELSGSAYRRSLLSDLQPMMLAAAEAVGVVAGAWASRAFSGEERPADGGTLLPAVGWAGMPPAGAAWLAIGYVAVRVAWQLTSALIFFGPLAYGIFASVKGLDVPTGILLISWPSFFAQAAAIAAYVMIGYYGVKRFGAPVTIWLALLAASTPSIASAISYLPAQYAALAQGGQLTPSVALAGVIVFVGWPLSALPPFVGVWFATRPTRMSESSATLPAQDNDHW